MALSILHHDDYLVYEITSMPKNRDGEKCFEEYYCDLFIKHDFLLTRNMQIL